MFYNFHCFSAVNCLRVLCVTFNIYVIVEFRVSCDKPMDVPDGSWYIVSPYLDFRRGSRVSYKCNDGFKLMGSSEIVCEVSGYWSDNAPKCLPKGKKIENKIKMY